MTRCLRILRLGCGLLVGCLLVSSCALPVKNQLSQQASEQLSEQTNIPADQLAEIGSQKLTDLLAAPELAGLIEQGLSANPSIMQTALALKISQLQYGNSQADQLPEASLQWDQQKQPAGASSTGKLSVSWTLDIWGRLQDAEQLANAQLKISQITDQAARDLLAGNIIKSWLAIARQNELIKIQQQKLDNLQKTERFAVDRYQKGLGELIDLDNAKTNRQSTQSTLIAYQETRAQLISQLAQQLGQSELDIADVQLPVQLPELNQLPSQNLAGRPDLKKAWQNIVAAELQSQIAYKQILPSFSLQASLTQTGNGLSSALFQDPAWLLLGQISAPIFNGGTLSRNAEIADLQAQSSFWAFQQTLLTATHEVDNGLRNDQSLKQQQLHLAHALTSAQKTYDYYLKKYQQGLVTMLDLLQVQQQVFNAKTQWLEAIYQRQVNRVDLGLALGLTS